MVVTARLARPVAPHELPPLPSEREGNNPNDFMFFLMGSDTGGDPPARPGAAPPPVNGGPSGARGFSR